MRFSLAHLLSNSFIVLL